MALFPHAVMSGGSRSTLRRLIQGAFVPVLLLAVTVPALPASASVGAISGVVFDDSDRDGLRDAGEAPMPDRRVYLYDWDGTYLATTTTDESGSYQFNALREGSYAVEVQWSPLSNDWVSTSTSTNYPRLERYVSDPQEIDFGFRKIMRSTDINAPISTYMGSNGLRVSAFNDAVDARAVFDAIMRGSVGAESSYTTVSFDYGSTSQTITTAERVNGVYTSFRAFVYVSYQSWISDHDVILAHEYGHAWSMYHAYITQQDPSFASYLDTRGLSADSRLGTSHAWSAAEMIAEDYRQLLGSDTAGTAPQENPEIAPAEEVPGLLEFLRDTYTMAPATASPSPAPEPTASPSPAPAESPSPEPSESPSPAPTTRGKGGGPKPKK